MSDQRNPEHAVEGNVFSQAVASGQSVMRIENETMQQFSITKPRPHPQEILRLVVAELEAFPYFAEKAFYRIEIKKKRTDPDDAPKSVIEGISIKGAEQIKRHWGNCTSGSRMVAEDERFVHVQGVAIDYETNIREAREWAVPKWEVDEKTHIEVPLTRFRLTTSIQAHMSKAERNAILLILPEPLKATYFKTAKEIAVRILGQSPKQVQDHAKPLPLPERIKKMFAKMEELGATEEQVMAFLGVKKRTEIKEDHLGKALGAYNSVMVEGERLDDVLGIKRTPTQTVGSKQLDAVFQNDKKK